MEWGSELRGRFPDWQTDSGVARWPEVRVRLSVGQSVRGEVVARAHFGVWLDVGVGWPALLRVTEMADTGVRRIEFKDYPKLGEFVEAKVLCLGEPAEIVLCQLRPIVEEAKSNS